MARVLLGVTGGIAAYKACELARLLVQAGHDVFPILTRSAERFVTRETFAALTRRSVDESPYPHLTKADLLVVAPLTANTLAKFAHGLADDVLSEAALAHRGPIIVAPGGTREPLDAVRYLGNSSSGRMGVALAEEARRRGAEVTLVASNLSVAPPAGVEVVEVPTAADLARETLARADADLVLMAAAVADYRPAAARADKRPKDDEP